jgi:hypothetical protein
LGKFNKGGGQGPGQKRFVSTHTYHHLDGRYFLSFCLKSGGKVEATARPVRIQTSKNKNEKLES